MFQTGKSVVYKVSGRKGVRVIDGDEVSLLDVT